MPFRSQAQRKFLYANHPEIAKRWSAEFPNQGKLPVHVKKKKKPSLVVDNKIKAYGEEQGGKIKINLSKHKGNKSEIADTVYHESYHAKHPKATEKVTYQKTHAAMKEMSYNEKVSLANKVKMKNNHYAQGAAKRKLGITRHEKMTPGSLISKMNEQKVAKRKQPKTSNFKLGVEALI